MKMKKTMIYLPEETHRYLARRAEEYDVSMAELVREAIAEYRGRRVTEEDGAAALVGCIEDALPDTDLALRVDEGLADHFAEGGEWERANGLCER